MAQFYFKVFYSKDVKKKKKVYMEGIFVQTPNKVKLYDENSTLIYEGSIRNKYLHNPDNEEEFIIGNIYYVSIDKPVSKERFQNGTAFMEKPPNVVLPKKVKIKQIEEEVKIEEGSIQLSSTFRIDAFIAKKLRPHQIQGIRFMFNCITGKKDPNNFGCILADYMGLGKTLQSLTLLYTCLKNSKNSVIINKAIVVSPLSLVKVWQKQLHKWFNDKIIPIVASGDRDNIKHKIQSFAKDKYRLLFVSYESFIKHMKVLNGNCDIIIFDEGHRLKNDKSKSYKMVKSFSCKRRILLTGTPLQNNMDEFYACISLVNPNLFSSQILFKNLFKKPIECAMKLTATETELKVGLQRSKRLSTIVKQFSLRRKGDVLQDILPSKKQYHVFLPLTEIQAKWSDKFIKQSGNKDIMHLMTMLRKLIVSANLFKQSLINRNQNFQDYSDDSINDISLKVQFVINVAKNCLNLNQKLVVVSNYTQNLTLIQSVLQQEGLKCFRLDGSMSDSNRQIQIEKFNNSANGSVFMLSSKAGGTGLNLTVANKMIMMQPDWNPSNDEQVMGRLWRDGQVKPVHIYRLISMSSFQERILQRQYLKKSLSDKLIDSSSVTQLFNMNQMRKLLILNSKKCLTYEQQANQLNEVKCWNLDFKNLSDDVFVCIRKNKNQMAGVNQFQNDDMFLNVEKQEEEDSIQEQDQMSDSEKQEKVQIKFQVPKIQNQIKQQSSILQRQIINYQKKQQSMTQNQEKIEVQSQSLSSNLQVIIKQKTVNSDEGIKKPYVNPLLKKALKLPKDKVNSNSQQAKITESQQSQSIFNENSSVNQSQ